MFASSLSVCPFQGSVEKSITKHDLTCPHPAPRWPTCGENTEHAHKQNKGSSPRARSWVSDYIHCTNRSNGKGCAGHQELIMLFYMQLIKQCKQSPLQPQQTEPGSPGGNSAATCEVRFKRMSDWRLYKIIDSQAIWRWCKSRGFLLGAHTPTPLPPPSRAVKSTVWSWREPCLCENIFEEKVRQKHILTIEVSGTVLYACTKRDKSVRLRCVMLHEAA